VRQLQCREHRPVIGPATREHLERRKHDGRTRQQARPPAEIRTARGQREQLGTIRGFPLSASACECLQRKLLIRK